MFCHRRSKKTREPRIASVTIPQRALCRDLTSWRRLVFTVAACAITAVIPDSLLAQRTELEKFIRHRVLSNGLEVIVAQNHGVPLATIEFNVRNGSFTQRPGTEGLAHMYEHMFFKANEQLPEPDAFIQRSSELGASFNGTTQEERVN
jgi:zinc protease